MKLEDQVCTLAQAHKFKKLGIAQIGSFSWDLSEAKKWCVFTLDASTLNKNSVTFGLNEDAISAFTVAELGVMLPTLGFEFGKSNNGNGEDFFWSSSNYWKLKGHFFKNANEAILRSEILIQMIESGSVTVEEVNKSLDHQPDN